MKITDINISASSTQFQVKVNGDWQIIDIADFFDFLAQTERIAGHDPDEQTAWTEDRGTLRFHPAYQEMRWSGRCCSRSYRAWLEDFVDEKNDETIISYLQCQLAA